MKPPIKFKLMNRSLLTVVLEADMPVQTTTTIIDVISYRGVLYSRTGIQGAIVTYVESIVHTA